jgi:hypothetical protein
VDSCWNLVCWTRHPLTLSVISTISFALHGVDGKSVCTALFCVTIKISQLRI